MKAQIRPLAAVIVVAAALVAGSVAIARQAIKDPLYIESIGRMQQLVTSVEIYASDYDDSLPLAHKWMDGLGPYVKNEIIFHSPKVASPGYGYALNSQYAGASWSSIAEPWKAILLFDSINLKRNATNYIDTEPFPARYSGRNTEAFADGEVNDYLQTLGPAGDLTLSLNRVKQLGLGNIMYANDYDDYLVPASTWADGTFAYLRDVNVYRSPLIQLEGEPRLFGYAHHSALSEQFLPSFSDPGSVIETFDSTKLYWNSNDNGQSLPKPGRYMGKNTIGYLDGHSAAK